MPNPAEPGLTRGGRFAAWSISRDSLLVLAALLLALTLRLPGLLESVWYDELWSTRIGLYSAGALIRSVLQDLHPPFYSVFMFLWIRIFGDSELSIRLPPLILGLATMVLAANIARRFGVRWLTGVTALLLAVSPVHIWYSQEARHYSAVLFLTLSAVEALLRLETSERPTRWLWIHALSLLFALLSHYYVLAIVPVLILMSPGTQRRKLIVIDSAVVLLLAGFLVVKSRVGSMATGALYLRSFDFAEAARLFDWLLTGNALWVSSAWKAWPMAAVPWLGRISALILLGIGVRTLFRRSARRAVHILLLALATPVLLAVLNVIGFDQTYIERSALVVLPFFLLLLAAGIGSLAHTRWRVPVLTALALFTASSVAGLYRHADAWTVYKPNPDWRSAASRLLALRSPEQPLLVFASTPATVLNYYRLDASEREVQFEDVVNSSPVPGGGVPGQSAVARLKRVLNSITAYGGPANLPPSFLRGSRDEIILMREPHDSVVPGILRRTGATRFFLIEDTYWPGGFSSVFQSVIQNPRYRLMKRTHFKGLELSEYQLAPTSVR